MSHKQVLLREDIDNLGARGEIVRVKAGYASLAECEVAWTTLVRALEPILSRPVPRRPQEART